MLGWDISCYRLAADSASDLAEIESAVRLQVPAVGIMPAGAVGALTGDGERLLGWRARLQGLDWLDPLLADRRAWTIRADGYPNLYAARAADVVEAMVSSSGMDERDAFRTPGHPGSGSAGWGPLTSRVLSLSTVVGPQQWLLIEAWDES